MYNENVKQFKVLNIRECPFRKEFKTRSRAPVPGYPLPPNRYYCSIDSELRTCEENKEPYESCRFPKWCHLETAYYSDDDGGMFSMGD